MSAAQEAAANGAGHETLDLAERFGRRWVLVPAVRTTHGGQVLKTYGVQTYDGLWVGRVHPIGSGSEERALTKRHATLFAASKDMAAVLQEALAAFGEAFEGDGEVDGAEMVAWFAGWRVRAKATSGEAGAS